MKKWSPVKRSGRFVAADISVIVSEEVFEQKIVSGLQAASSVRYVSFFRSRFSTIASMIRSQSARSSRRAVDAMRFRAASRSPADSLPLSTAFASEP